MKTLPQFIVAFDGGSMRYVVTAHWGVDSEHHSMSIEVGAVIVAAEVAEAITSLLAIYEASGAQAQGK